MRRSIERLGARFLKRIFSPREISYCRKFKMKPEVRFAARFAAKEAAAKALGLGIAKGIRWPEIEVFHDKNGAPRLRITGRAAELARARGVMQWLLSITHTESLATAIVIALG